MHLEKLAGASGPSRGRRCCCNAQVALLVLCLIEATFVPLETFPILAYASVSMGAFFFARWVYLLACAFMGISVFLCGLFASQETMKRVSRVQYPMQHFAFWIKVIPDVIVSLILLGANVVSNSSNTQVDIIAFLALMIATWILVMIGVTLWYHFLCKFSRSVWLIAEAGGTGFEGMSAEELVDRAAKDAEYAQLKARYGDQIAAESDYESERLLPQQVATTIQV